MSDSVPDINAAVLYSSFIIYNTNSNSLDSQWFLYKFVRFSCWNLFFQEKLVSVEMKQCFRSITSPQAVTFFVLTSQLFVLLIAFLNTTKTGSCPEYPFLAQCIAFLLSVIPERTGTRLWERWSNVLKYNFWITHCDKSWNYHKV